jgi:putative N-acetylmannosamine-6-phosphate epimerase
VNCQSRIDYPWELVAWAKAAQAAGAAHAWLDPVLDCQAIDPRTELPIAELIEQASKMAAAIGEAN